GVELDVFSVLRGRGVGRGKGGAPDGALGLVHEGGWRRDSACSGKPQGSGHRTRADLAGRVDSSITVVPQVLSQYALHGPGQVNSCAKPHGVGGGRGGGKAQVAHQEAGRDLPHAPQGPADGVLRLAPAGQLS
ncbi:unnamed protein product, partial [Ectocarpus sp. 12 AP-2014]